MREVLVADDHEHGILHRREHGRIGRSLARPLHHRSQGELVLAGRVRVVREDLRTRVGGVARALERRDDLLPVLRTPVLEHPVADAREHDAAEPGRFLEESPQHGHRTEGESDGVDHRRAVRQAAQEPLVQTGIRSRVMGLLFVAVPEQVHTDDGPAPVLEQGVHPR